MPKIRTDPSALTPDQPAEGRQVPQPVTSHPPRSMHDDVPVWYDCCSCEAEPYWLEAFGEANPAPDPDDEGQGPPSP